MGRMWRRLTSTTSTPKVDTGGIQRDFSTMHGELDYEINICCPFLISRVCVGVNITRCYRVNSKSVSKITERGTGMYFHLGNVL